MSGCRWGSLWVRLPLASSWRGPWRDDFVLVEIPRAPGPGPGLAPMSGVQTVVVAQGEGDQRLDRWLRRRFPHVTQGRIEKLCRKGEIRVDGARVKGATRIEPGQVVRVPPLPDAPPPEPAARAAGPDAEEAEALRARVLFRDDHMIVLDKPPGLAVQGGSGQQRHLGAMLAVLRFGREDDPRLVHRLDRDTSGLLVLA